MTTNTDPAVEAVRVHRSFGDTEVLRGIDLHAEHGEWVALMGPSGCGKSTLLHLLAGLDRPSSGAVHIGGEAMHSGGASQRADIRRRKIGIVFQNANLLAHLDVRSNVELAGRVGGLGRREARSRATELLDQLGLSRHLTSAPAMLSGGEQQRVAIARALVNRPAVVFADEPTGSLDSVATGAVLDLLRSIHNDGPTIVMVTHDQRVAAQADRIVRLRDGQVSSNDDRHQLVRSAAPALLRRPGFDDDHDNDFDGDVDGDFDGDFDHDADQSGVQMRSRRW